MSSDDSSDLIFTNPRCGEGKYSIVCLKQQLLCLAVVAPDAMERSTALLAEKGILETATNIPLSAIEGVRGAKGDHRLSLAIKQAEGKIQHLTLNLTDGSKRDELIDALENRLGPEWERQEIRMNRFIVSFVPLAAALFFLFITWFLNDKWPEIAAACGRHEIVVRPWHAHRKVLSWKIIYEVFIWIGAHLNPSFVLVVGGLLIAACLMVLIAVVCNPPSEIILKARKSGRVVVSRHGT